MNYKNKFTGEVISYECYRRLPYTTQMKYRNTSEYITHQVSDDFDILTPIIAAELLSNTVMNDETSGFDVLDNTPDTSSSSDFSGFGGGGDW